MKINFFKNKESMSNVILNTDELADILYSIHFVFLYDTIMIKL